MNLVSNAIKFQKSGEIYVLLSKFEGFLRLEVLDQGLGIDPKM
ncbi:MAG: ATP-binding protein [bacterium]